METITASITLPTEDIEAFADSVGYFEFEPDGVTPNPKTRVEHVKEWFVGYALQAFAQNAENAIRVIKNDEAQALISAKKDELRAAISIT